MTPSAIAQPESTSTQSRDYNNQKGILSLTLLHAGININPVAGLQQLLYARLILSHLCRNQHQPSRGITTWAVEGMAAL